MPAFWIFFRICCVLQILSAGWCLLGTLYGMFIDIRFGDVAGTLVFLFAVLLSFHALTLVQRNYPDKPVEGDQKKAFNRLFLVNFFGLAFLFGFILRDINTLRRFSNLVGVRIWSLPVSAFLSILLFTLILLLQLLILYGLFRLRRELCVNADKKQFEFERK